jgi:mRNA interferase RelE/StbE
MSSYTVVLTKSAEKELHKLPSRVINRLISLLKSLEINPRPAGCKKLKGHKNLWRVRSGDYRIIYAIEDIILLVDVREIGNRKDIYDSF